MPITIRDKTFERRIARESRRRGGISMTASVKSLATERLEQIEQSATAVKQANEQPAMTTASR